MKTANKDPFSLVGSALLTEFERLFSAATSGGTEEPAFEPQVNLIEEADRIVVFAAIPGVDADSVDITLEPRQLIITGERRLNPAATGRVAVNEISDGQFERKIAIPSDVAIDEANATSENGIIQVIVPKRQATPHRKVTVPVQR